MVSRLEVLPNELFKCVFRRLSIIDIYHSFSNLNDRFTTLITDFTQRKNIAIDGYLTWFQVSFAIEHVLPLIDENQLRILEIRHTDLFHRFVSSNNFIPSFVTTLSLVSLSDVSFDVVYNLLIRCPRVRSLIIDVECVQFDTTWLNGSLWDELVDSYCVNLSSLRVSVYRIFKDQSISKNDIINSFRSSIWQQRQWMIDCQDQENTRQLTIRACKSRMNNFRLRPMYLFTSKNQAQQNVK